MVSNKKTKKVLITIIISILIFAIVSFTITKIIYDNIFTRYDCSVTVTDDKIKTMVDSRDTFNYPSGDNSLSGYLYKCNTESAQDTLIVLAPGFAACSDSYLWQIYELLEYGWSVFAFDPTGSCNSEGNSSIGFPQEVLDLKATLNFIEKNNQLDYNNIVLLGHSRGGYAACCALNYEYDISAVISISGINSAMDGVIGSSKNYVGNFAYANYGFLWLYQTILFGSDTVNLRADKILSSSDVPTLIVHGADDESVPIDKHSIISHKNEIDNQNIEYIICSAPQNSGHTNLLFDKDGTADNHLIKEINDFLIKNIE